MATVEELAAFVQTAAGGTVFRQEMPDEPDACGVVIETGGTAPEHVFGHEGIAIENPRAQVSFRGEPNDDIGPRAKAEAAYRALAALSNQVLSGTRWLEARPLQAPFPLRRDTKRRALFGFNVQIAKELSV